MDKYGWQYIQDYAAITFYFGSAKLLMEALNKFLMNSNSNDFAIIQIENKILTPLALVNMVVHSYSGGTTGEVQFKVYKHEFPP